MVTRPETHKVTSLQKADCACNDNMANEEEWEHGDFYLLQVQIASCADCHGRRVSSGSSEHGLCHASLTHKDSESSNTRQHSFVEGMELRRFSLSTPSAQSQIIAVLGRLMQQQMLGNSSARYSGMQVHVQTGSAFGFVARPRPQGVGSNESITTRRVSHTELSCGCGSASRAWICAHPEQITEVHQTTLRTQQPCMKGCFRSPCVLSNIQRDA